jgi:ribonuclease P protein component
LRGEQYLTKAAQFASVYSRGGSWANDLVVMRASPNGLGASRYGISVSRRVGNAVVRNRVKRRLREILRPVPLAPGWDIVLIARAAAANAGYADLEKSVKGLLSRAHLQAEEHEKVSLSTD